MQHVECIAQFEALKLGGKEAEAARRHLEQCGPCQRLFAAYDVLAEAPDLSPMVMQAILPPAKGWPWAAWLAPMAAAFALAMLISAFWKPEQQWLNEDRGYAWEERGPARALDAAGQQGRHL